MVTGQSRGQITDILEGFSSYRSDTRMRVSRVPKVIKGQAEVNIKVIMAEFCEITNGQV